MQTQKNTEVKRAYQPGFISYATQRLVLATILIVAVVGGIAYGLNRFDIGPHLLPEPDQEQQELAMMPLDPEKHPSGANGIDNKIDGHKITAPASTAVIPEVDPKTKAKQDANSSTTEISPLVTSQDSIPAEASKPAEIIPVPVPVPATLPASKPEAQIGPPTDPPRPITAPPREALQAPSHNDRPRSIAPPERHPARMPETRQPTPHAPAIVQPRPHQPDPKPSYRPAGVTFVEAIIQPIDHELNQRFWGWRPNDIINLTDNISNYQLGTLEVTRRTVVQLAERISRTGSTDAFNQHLENAMNWFMVKSDRYWFPAPESKYGESLQELEIYKQELIDETASFYTRADNLIPLLKAYENLLGSCDENLVKHTEMDASKVSIFKADNYFYYAKGVASTMAVILEAIHHDFSKTLENRNGSDLLHHAITSCGVAAELNPWFITNSDLDGLFANHRANMAAPISHARFYVAQLIKTLST